MVRHPSQRPSTWSLFPAVRRVTRVEVTVSGHNVTARVVGMGYHRPVVMTVPVSLANRLVSEGAPLHVRWADDPGSTGAAA